MTLLMLTVIIYLFVYIGLSCGVLMKRSPLAGSCGGASILPTIACSANCRQKCEKVETITTEQKISLRGLSPERTLLE